MIKKSVIGRTYKRAISTLLAIAMSFSALSVGSFSVDDPLPSDETEVVSTVDDTSDTTENSTQETVTSETETTETTTVSETTETEYTESTETTDSTETEPTPEPAYVSPISIEIVSETDNTVTLSGYNLPDAVTYKVISNGMVIAETFSIENYTLTGLLPGSYFEFLIEAYNIDGSLIGQSESIFGYTDLTVSSNYTLYGDLVVADLTINSGVFNLNGYSLTVMNDANINSGTLDINSGGIYINGDASFGYISNNSYVYLDMTNANDYMLVKGDFYFRSYYSQSGYLTAGTLEVKGDFTQRSSSNNAGFYASGTHTTILTGEGLQKINFDNTSARFNTLEIRNFSVEGVILETTVTRNRTITNGCNISVYNGDRSGWTLTADETIDGDVYLTSDVLDLNGYTLTINGNLTQSGGTVKVNGGELNVSGDYRIQSLSNNTYANSAGILNMTNASDVVSVGGSFITQSTINHTNYLTAGTLEVGGNFKQIYGNDYNFHTSGDHTLVLNGTTAQEISIANYSESYSRINSFKIENTSETGVTFARTVYVVNELYNSDSKINNVSNLYITSDTTFPDGEWNNDLYLRNNLALSGNLHITGDLYLESGTLTINKQKLTVDGNFYHGTHDSLSYAYFKMIYSSDYVLVGGDYYSYSNYSMQYCLTAGILEIKGNVTQRKYETPYGFCASNSHNTVLSGDSLQIVDFENVESQFNTVQISNTSEAGVVFATTIARNQLIIDNGAKLTLPDGERSGWTLTADETIDGDLLLASGYLYLNGFTLTITGDLIQSGGFIGLFGGKLIVNGDYRIQTLRDNGYASSTGILMMSNDSDVVSVGGSFITQSTKNHSDSLFAGTLEVGGDVIQLKGHEGNFSTYGTHTLVLNGNAGQSIDIDPSCAIHSPINNLKIENSSDDGVTFKNSVYVFGELYNTESNLTNLQNLNIYERTTFPDGEWNHDLYLSNRYGTTLPAGFTVNGDLYFNTEMYLIGDLHIKGDFYLQNGSLTLNGHKMIVDGDFFHGTPDLLSTGFYRMSYDNDYMFVGGDYFSYLNYYNQYNLYAGTLEIKGDVTQKYHSGNDNSRYGFYSTGSHKTVLSGDSLQTVNFESIESQFNIVQISNTSEDGVVFATTITRNNTIIDKGAKLTLPDGESSSWTLTQDETIDGDLYITTETLNLNGFTLTVNGNLTQAGGTVFVNDGKLIVNGDYKIQDSDDKDYPSSTGILNMTNASDIVSVSGSFITQSSIDHREYLTAGTLEVGGDFKQIHGNNYNFHTSGDHTLVLNGTVKQEISFYYNYDSESYSRINNLKIENTSTDGVIFSDYVYVVGELYDTESRITNPLNIRTYQKTTFPDDSWSNDLNVYGNLSIHDELRIDGDLYLNSSMILYADLHVTGDLYLQSGTLTVNGYKIIVDGDFNYFDGTSPSDGYFKMTNASDYVLVGGDLTVYTYYSNSEIMTAGTLEIKGNVTQKYHNTQYSGGYYGFHATGSHKTILSGDSLQTVSFENIESQFSIVQINNTSEDGVVFTTAITRNELIIDEGSKLTLPNGERSGWTVTQDETADGDLILNSGTLDLNGFTLTINGNLTQSGGIVNVNNGKLIVNGDYRIQTDKNGTYANSVGILNMTNASDIVSVSGSFITQSTIDHSNYLTAGTLEIGGNLQQLNSSNYNFYTSGTHTTILNGTTAQTVKVADSAYSYSHINNLKIKNTSETGVTFSTSVYVLGELHDTDSKLTNLNYLYTYTSTTFPDGEWNHDLYLHNNTEFPADFVINGNLYLRSDLTLSSDLHITGDMNLQRGILTVNGHKLTVDGDFNYSNNSSQSNGYFIMTNVNDYVLVGGNYYVFTQHNNRGNMTAGVLEIKGNVTQKYSISYNNTEYGFYASGTHKTILSGDLLQTVNFDSTQSRFNILELTKDFTLGYEFNRNPMWNMLEYSGEDSVAPGNPTNLSLTASSTTYVYLNWHAAYDNVSVAGYKIYRDGVYVGQTTETEYIDNRLLTNETYGYYISAFDYSGNESGYSNAIAVSTGTDAYAPSKPANLSVSSQTENTISLSWLSSADNVSVDGYNIYRDDKLIGSVRNKTKFTDQNAPGGLYTYFVRAYDDEGNLSIASDVVKTDNLAPSKPVITIGKITETTITLSWTSVDNAAGLTYDLYKNGTRIKTQIADSTYLDLQVSISNEYSYYVIAYDAYKNASEKSEICSVSTGKDEIKPTVSNVTISNGNKIAVVSVSASDNHAIASVTVEYSSDKINWTATEPALTDKTTTVKKSIPVNYSGLEDGVYYFRATATDVSGNVSETSPVTEFIVDNTAPHTPFELSSDVTNGSIYIAWHYDTSDTDISYFRIFRMKDDSGDFELIGDNWKNISYYDFNFEVGFEYGYRITAVDKSGNESSYSATKRATVESDDVVPSVLSIYPTTGTKISNNFDMSVACFDNIRLKTLTISVKRTDSETWETLNTTELDTYHKVTDIEVDTSSFTTGQYEFKAIVTDAYGNESTAKSVTYSFKTSTLSAPVLTTTGAGWRAELSWTMTNTEDIAGYYIYRHALTENAFKHIAGVTRTSFTDKNVNAGEKYFYRIEAIDTYGNSTVSEDVSVVPTHEDEIKPMASAGSDLLAIAGESVSFDGSKSLDNNYVESYSWDFGDGTTASSASASHTYAEKGTYNATLTVTDSSGNTASDTVSVTVYGSENDKFTIKTMSGGAKLPRVNIICDEILGKGARAYTNSNGEYTFIAPEGEYTLMLYADGHLPITQTVKSSETTTIKLIEKKFVEGKLTARELDYNEIVTLGIDTTDPANRYVFEYIVRADHKVDEEGETFTVIRTNAKGDIITDNDNSGLHETYIKNGFAVWDIHNEESFGSGGYGGGSDTGSGGSGGGGGGGKNNAGTYYGQYATEKLKTFKTIAFMQINTDITWLKGFYSVDLIIMNNADEDFYIDHALASIILPDGLSLANTADINPETKTIGRIVGGETKVISWMVRGDIAGSYDIFAQFTGSLEPFGVPIEIEFKTESPVVVEDGNTLYLNIVHDLWSEDNDVWKIDYKLTNAGETPVYDLQFEIIAEYAENCGMDIEKIEIYQIDREGPDVIRWEDGKPKIDDMESRFNPLTEGIPDSTINLDPDEYLEFTVFVTKE